MRSACMFPLFLLAMLTAHCGLAVSLSPSARLMPLVIGLPAILMAGAVVMREWKAPAARDHADDRNPAELHALLWIAVFFLAILLFGFIFGATLATAAYFRLSLRYRLEMTLAAAAICLLLTYGLFETILDVPLFKGLVMP